MSWIKLVINSPADQAEAAAELLENLGASSITFADQGDEPILEPAPGEFRLWSATEVTGLFPASADSQALSQALEAHYCQQDNAQHPNPVGKTPSTPTHRIEILEDRDWVREWMQHFQPMAFGARLWIVPTGHRPPQPDATNLRLDPGLAFGSGTHPTTRLCLQWLDRQAATPTGLAQQRVLDFGCGSGVLATAALLLGASTALGIDIDPQALTASRANAELNGVSPALELGDGAHPIPAAHFNAVLANILAGPLTELAPALATAAAPGAKLALSGLLTEQAEAVAAHYQPWFHIEQIVHDQGWALIEGQRRLEKNNND